LILDMLLTSAVLAMTMICGAPIVFSMALEARWLTKMALSFALGYVVISLAGISAALMGLDPIILQGITVLIGAGLSLRYWRKIRDGASKGLDREDWIIICIGSLYSLICILFFDRIIMWMGGDAVAHASIIRMLLDGNAVPISIPPFGSYWEYYPKGFHFYSYPWARLFPILNVIQSIPVLMTAATPVLLYSIVREQAGKNDAIYAFVLACFVFPAHYSYLIWAGYPSAAAEMLLVAALLAALVERRALTERNALMEMRILPILLLGILFTHARLLVLVCGVLLGWLLLTRLSRYLPYILAGIAALIIAAFAAFSAHRPEFLVSVATSQELASEYAARWYPAFISLFGAVIALSRRDQLDRLAMAWAGVVILMVLLADVGILEFVSTADRMLLGLYLPLSLLAASALSRMEGFTPKIRAGFVLILLLSGAAAMGAVFYSYAGSWAIPPEDYEAIMWLGEQNYTDAIYINLDETGAWIYPLTGAQVAVPRVVPGPDKYYNSRFINKIIADPNDTNVVNTMERSKYKNDIIYISSVTINRPGHVPPFADFRSAYPNVNLNFSEKYYDLVYAKGPYVFKFKNVSQV
jgi:hypothetical protein